MNIPGEEAERIEYEENEEKETDELKKQKINEELGKIDDLAKDDDEENKINENNL